MRPEVRRKVAWCRHQGCYHFQQEGANGKGLRIARGEVNNLDWDGGEDSNGSFGRGKRGGM